MCLIHAFRLKTFKSELAEKAAKPTQAMITLVLGLRKLFAPYGRQTGAVPFWLYFYHLFGATLSYISARI